MNFGKLNKEQDYRLGAWLEISLETWNETYNGIWYEIWWKNELKLNRLSI